MEATLTRLEHELAQSYDAWLAALRANLNDPIASEGVDLWDNAAIRGSIRAFCDGADLPEPLPQGWTPAVNAILGGLERLTLTGDGLLAALGSTPMTREEFEQWVKQFLDQQMQGRDARKMRIVVE